MNARLCSFQPEPTNRIRPVFFLPFLYSVDRMISLGVNKVSVPNRRLKSVCYSAGEFSAPAMAYELHDRSFLIPMSPPALFRAFPSSVFGRLAMLGAIGSLLFFSSTGLRAQREPVRKVIHQYALTSANDFPQRDPQDWRLLGSNDGGKNWTVLDVRRDEIFQSRQQRKQYRISNDTAYETYRLQIDRVRDPVMVNSVQLAEIEVMGRNDDDFSPMPGLTDLIIAEGDNPPSEVVGNLFDGKVETKWLGWPTNEVSRSSWIQWKYLAPSQVILTNAVQLQSLGARAENGYRISVVAVYAGRSTPGGKMCFVDTTAGVELGDIAGAENLAIGQKALITGTILKTGKQISFKQVQATAQGTVTNENPQSLSLEQPFAPGENLKWAQIEGDVQYQRSTEGLISFDLADGAANMQVHLVCPTNSHVLPPSGTRVSVRGICLGAFNDQGQWEAAELWAAGWNSLSVVSPPTRTPLLTVHRRQHSPGGAGATNLTTIEQIRHLPPDQINAHPRVKIRAIITGFLEGFVQDDTGGIEVVFPADESRKLTETADYIEVDGTAELDEVGNPQIAAEHVTVLGKGKLPQPQRLTLTQLMSGRMEGQWIEIEGVVHSTDGSHMLLISYGREVMASLALAPTEVVNKLVDAEVRVRGVGVTAMDEQGRIQGIHLLIPSLDHLEVLDPPGDPRSLPLRPIGSLLGVSGPRESFHRVKIAGIVTLCDANRVFLQDDTGSAMSIFKEEVRLDANFGRSRWLYWRSPETNAVAPANPQFAPGDRVEAVGFPETRRYSPVLTEVALTRLASRALPKTEDLTAKGIEEGGFDSSLVTFDGLLRARNVFGGNIVLTFDWRDRTLQVLVPEKETDVLDISLDSSVRVTGVCQVDPSPYAELGLRAAAVRILARNSGDLMVLEEPSWWTIERALMVVGGMALAILAALIWIKELRRQVEERTVQLTTEVELREQTERQHALDQERARIAKDLHDDLGANLTQIVFLCQRVEVTRNEDGKDLARWFNLIPETARRTIQSLDEIVWAINPRHDSLESLANYLSQFAQEHLTLARVRCVLDVPMVLPTLALTAEVRHNLLLTVREALQNVVSHAAATEVQLTLKLVADGISIRIADDGKGFDVTKASSEGNGLHNMRRRLEEIGGKFEITSQAGHGTTVTLFVPHKALHGRVIGEPAVPNQPI